MDRTYLFVPPEEYAELRSLGGSWDDLSKRWYIGPEDTEEKFSRWLPSAEDDEELGIISSEAYVAAATVTCWQCQAAIEVICIYCESGVSLDEPLTQFTISGIWAMDEELARQLGPWPTFRKDVHAEHGAGNFSNHCSHCGAPQDELELHDEPDSPFFDIPGATPGSVRLTPLVGTVRLSGDERFVVG
jgi:hypothetical protein